MRVIVTGSSGKIGREAMRALKAAGHRPLGLDVRPSPDGARTVPVDCADFGEVMGAFSAIDTAGGVPDAVVHLAGIPAPGLANDARIFQVNTLSTYNVFSACARLGIQRIVWASSETLFGLPFTTPPDYLPVDEDHEVRPEWSYSLSKQMGEAMADQFARWHPAMTIVSLRFSNVFSDADYAQLAAIHARPEARKMNLWGYVDAADAGEACRLAVDAPLSGHQRFTIAAPDTIAQDNSNELAAKYFPDAPIKTPLSDFESLLSIKRARDMLGYHPKVSWRMKKKL